MLNVNELENRHKKYRLKSYIPYLAILSGIIVAIISISFFLIYDFGFKKEPNKDEQIAQKKEIKQDDYNTSIIITQEKNETAQEEETPIPEIAKEIPEIEEAVEVAEVAHEKVILSPSLNFIKNIESQAPITEETITTLAVAEEKKELPVQKKETAIKKEKKDEILLPVIEEVKESIPVVEKPTSIDIKRRDEEEDIKHVIKRFNINHNPALSLFVAKKYYQLEDYEQSYNYALATNELNNDIEASWIIFSKSLVKLGKKEMAIQTLKKYINHSNSSQAKQLLDEILSGKFK